MISWLYLLLTVILVFLVLDLCYNYCQFPLVNLSWFDSAGYSSVLISNISQRSSADIPSIRQSLFHVAFKPNCSSSHRASRRRCQVWHGCDFQGLHFCQSLPPLTFCRPFHLVLALAASTFPFRSAALSSFLSISFKLNALLGLVACAARHCRMIDNEAVLSSFKFRDLQLWILEQAIHWDRQSWPYRARTEADRCQRQFNLTGWTSFYCQRSLPSFLLGLQMLCREHLIKEKHTPWCDWEYKRLPKPSHRVRSIKELRLF